jgi:hypothetical protein
MQLELGDDRVIPSGSSGSNNEPTTTASGAVSSAGSGSNEGVSSQSMDTRHMLRELLSQDEYVASISK